MAESTTKVRVLVADDDPEILKLVTTILSNEGIQVITARDGREAVEKAMEQRPDAILLDISMPRLDGIEACAMLKAAESTAGIPVGFLTARDEIECYKEAVKLGILVYVTKPFQPEKLITFVRMLLSGTAGDEEESRGFPASDKYP